MDEQLHNELNHLLHQLAFMSNAQASGKARATATGEDPAPLGHQSAPQPPLPPIIVYLVDTPPVETYEDDDEESFAESVESCPHTHREEARTTSSRGNDERATAVPLSPLPQRDTPLRPATTRPRQQGKRGVLVGVLCVLLAGAALGASLLALLTASATVTLIPQARAISTTTRLTVVTEGPDNPLHHEVSGRWLSALTLSQERTVQTTGTGHQPAQAAHGMLTFYNASLAMQTVSAGTVLVGADGVEVVTEQDAVLPAGSLATNGQVSVPAHAVIAGPTGNIQAGDIYGPCCRLNVLVQNRTAFQGGQEARSFPMVSPADLNGTIVALVASLQESIQAALAVQLHPDESLLPPLCTPTVSANHAVGEEASQLRVTVDETCTGLAYSTQALHDLMTQVVTGLAIRQLGGGYSLAGRVEVTLVKSTSERGQQGSITFQVKGRGVWAYQFTEAELHHLATLIAGKSTREARTVLLRVAGVQSVIIQLSAGVGTSSTLPDNPGQIKMGELLGFGL